MPLSHTDSGFSNLSTGRQRRLSRAAEEQGPIFLGIAAAVNGDTVSVALAAHDQTYLLDYAIEHLPLEDDSHEGEDIIADYVVQKVEDYEHRNLVKFIGAGLPSPLTKISPTLCSRLWLDADIVPIVLSPKGKDLSSRWEEKELDEQADSMARKCVMNFGPSLVPLLQVGFRGAVMVDAGFRAQINRAEDHQALTCSTATWDALMHYAGQLKQKGTKIAFFSATPQGGGVALMRHALVRFCRLIGVDLSCSKAAPGRLQKYSKCLLE
ncbi:hypothetical protein DL769_010586 [Monosporascus sp. CRB-8-3]|nr:hypothetical protein DL769_010586 [Monosporascus sp. CRB-8-3]